MQKMQMYLTLGLLAWCIFSCEKILPSGLPEEELLDGTIEGLTDAQLAQFERGDVAFREVFTKASGLGPVFVTASCGSCHAGDGKGHPFTTLTRFGQYDHTGNKYTLVGGPQLQNRALPGFEPEVIPAGATFASFTPPANTGLGFIELVSDATILAMADPNDNNRDGISGVPNYASLPDYVVVPSGAIPSQGKYVTRFGKKGSTFDLLQQTVNAYNQDMGITSALEPIDAHTLKEIEPEVSMNTVNDVVFYLQTLKAPIQRNAVDADVQTGKSAFIKIGCENCHKQTLKTGYSPVPALSNQTFSPYTDLLLHDMGKDLDDGYTEGTAKTYEWRTAPLWGLGLSANSQGGQYFLMHDGRAKSIEEAILLHGGEALSSRNKYQALSTNEKVAIVKFLNSL
jgi:CxxC motif-containing protein (DUF1111 family)